MAEGGNGNLGYGSSTEKVAEVLSEKTTSSSSSDSEFDMPGSPNAGACAPPPPPPLPLAAAAAACAAIAGEMNGIDRLLQKQRNDRMYELRKIKHSERPVSSTDSKQKLEKFFAQSTEPSSSQPIDQSARPDSVRVEVSGLLERRPVSSVIQSNQFRRDLEDVIRGSLVRQERELQTALRLQSAGLPVNQQSAPIVAANDPSQHSDTLSQASYVSSAQSSAHSSIEQQWNAPPVPPPMPQMSPGMPQSPWQQSPPWQQQQQAWSQWQQQQAQNIQSPPWQQAWQQQQWQQPPWQQAPWQQQQSWQRPPWMQQQPPPVQPQQPWLTQHSQPMPAQQEQNRNPNILAEVQQQHRESIVVEISDLVHRQLVSNTLESTFRGQLENAMLGRLEQAGHDGIAVMEAVRALPTDPNYRRNDFSHLGIQAPVRQQDMGATGGIAMGWGGAPDMDAMRRQLEELQNMVRLSFDLQLDMQRAIRQEVSAALACKQSGENGSNPADAADSVTPTGTRPASEGSCLICLDNTVDTVLYQCGHMCVCLSCGMRLKGMGAHCPMCRAPIRDVIRAFRCQQPE